MKKEKIIISACLLGYPCRYDGKKNEILLQIKKLIEDPLIELIPVCPEQLGGLPTPRTGSEIIKNKVINQEGIDVTKEFQKGAEETLKIVKANYCKKVILKSKSPSCGYGQIYDGTFTRTLINGNGITTRLLLKNNIKIFTEKDNIFF